MNREIERIETLSNKLCHEKFDIKLRAATNLLFKLKSGILEKDILSCSNLINTLSNAVYNSIIILLKTSEKDNLQNPDSGSCKLLNLLLLVIQQIAADPSSFLAIDSFTKILEKLYFLMSMDLLTINLKKDIELVSWLQYLSFFNCLN
jgi:hypothetical protein